MQVPKCLIFKALTAKRKNFKKQCPRNCPHFSKKNLIRWCGGIGRRKGLKILRWQHRTGSTPVTSTTEALDLSRASAFFMPEISSRLKRQNIVKTGCFRNECGQVYHPQTLEYQRFQGCRSEKCGQIGLYFSEKNPIIAFAESIFESKSRCV